MPAPVPSQFLGLLFGIASALAWGGGDFIGGRAASRLNQFQVLILTSSTGLAAMLALVLLTSEAYPHPRQWAWAVAAGIVGGLGIAYFYKGLADCGAATVAPTAAVVGTALPVVATAFLEGLPGRYQLIGMLLGCVGIWLVARTPNHGEAETRRGLWIGVVSGLCFGGFFTLIAQIESEGIFAPLTISKATASLVALLLLVKMRLRLPSPIAHPLALLAGLMDAGGNVFYLLSARYARIDIAAVLSSMAPAITVLLSAIFVRERVNRSQWLGVLLCLAATLFLAL